MNNTPIAPVHLLNTNQFSSQLEYNHTPSDYIKKSDNIKKQRAVLVSDTDNSHDYKRTTDDTMGNFPYKHILTGIQEITPFSALFFSRQNVDELHRRVRYEVHRTTGKIISKQDEIELITIMRGTYLQHSLNPQYKSEYKAEINRLNNVVINELLTDLISNVQQYIGYIKDITSNPVPLATPINTSITGTKTGRSIMDILVGNSIN
jgi:hypothetical protein